MSNRAWVTLATNDSYGLGALVLAHSLRRAASSYPAAVLITPSVTEAMRDRLRAVFADVVIVDVLDSKDAAHLALLQRPELGITFTKIHCWGLTQYEKCVFLDADTLIIQNCDELFDREELSAAPDVGWPDCFNSGVFVYKPSQETFEKLIKFAQERGSFDGGDQGLLNSFFSDWAHGDINKHLPFLYNVTSAAFYSYIPALKHYGQDMKVIHFIGAAKPWLQQFNWESRTVDAPDHLRELLQLWWDLFVGQVHSQLDESMVEVQEGPPALPPQDVNRSQHYKPTVDPESEFPWHHPSAQIQENTQRPEIDLSEFHDPWGIYRGQIPSNKEETAPPPFSGRLDDHEEMKKYAWEYQPSRQDNNAYQETYSQQYQSEHYHSHHSHQHSKDQVHSDHHWETGHHHGHGYDDAQHDHIQHTHAHYHQQHSDLHHESKHEYIEHSHDHHNTSHHSPIQHHYSHIHSSHDESHNSQHEHNIPPQKLLHKPSDTNLFSHVTNRVEQIHHVSVYHDKDLSHESHEGNAEGMMNGDVSDTEEEYYEEIVPRHPYDGFYLRHRVVIDSQGRKVCTHEVPPTPSPSLSPPLDYEPTDDPAYLTAEDTCSNSDDDKSGVAGNLARVVPGASSQREALDELTRRQGWEAGNIDYMGADSFDNIWAKISQTLSQPRVSPPKQTSPPPKEPSPPKEPVAPVEVAQEASVVDPAASEAAAAPIALAECPAPLIPAAAEAPAQPEAEKIPVAEVPVVVEAAKVVQAPAPVEEPPAPADIPATVEAKTEVPASEIPASVEAAVAEAAAPIAEVPDVAEIPATVEACAPGEAPVPIEASASEAAASESPKEAAEKAEPTLPPTPPVTPKSTPEASTPVTESDPQVEVETQKEVVPESVAAPQPCGPVVAPQASEPVAAPPLSESVASSQPSESVDAPVPSEPVETPTTSDRVEAPKPTEPVEAPKPTEPLEAPKPTETVETSQPPTPVVAPSSDQASPAAATEQVSEATPAAATPEKPLAAPLAAATPDKSIEMSPAASDSPPLANTPSKEDAPAVPSAKSTEEAAQETRL